MSPISKPRSDRLGILATAFFLLGIGAAPADTFGPNGCQNSSGTDCQIQVSAGNTGLDPAYTGPFVSGDISIVNNKTLQFSFSSNNQIIGNANWVYWFNHLALDIADPRDISSTRFVSASIDGAGSNVQASDVFFDGAIAEPAMAKGGFGNFSVSISGRDCSWRHLGDCDFGFDGAVTELTFDVTWANESTVDWTDLHSDQLLLSSIAAHLYPVDPPLPAPASEPATSALLLTGLVSLGLAKHRRDAGGPLNS